MAALHTAPPLRLFERLLLSVHPNDQLVRSQGACGQVVEAVHPSSSQLWAVKQAHDDCPRSLVEREHRGNVALSSAGGHANVLAYQGTVHSTADGEEHQLGWLCFELMRGGSLKDLLK